MEFNIIVNQAALRVWIERGQVDADDGVLVAFIRGLHPDDEAVKRLMHKDYYRLTLSWILREVPILAFTEDRLSRRLHDLKKAGLVDLLRLRDDQKQWKLYGKLSAEYYREEQKARDEVAWAKTPMGGPRVETPMGENTRGYLGQTPAVKTPIDHKKDDHKSEDAAASDGSGAPASLEELLRPIEQPVTKSVEELAVEFRTGVLGQSQEKAQAEMERLRKEATVADRS